MSPTKRAKLEEKLLSQLSADATEAEKAVYLETALYERVTLIVSRNPFSGRPDEDDVLAFHSGIRKRTVENLMESYAQKYPDAHIALFSTSDDSDGMPIYIYN